MNAATTDLDHVTICRKLRSMSTGDSLRFLLADGATLQLTVVQANAQQGLLFTHDELGDSGTITVWGNDNHATYRARGKGATRATHSRRNAGGRDRAP